MRCYRALGKSGQLLVLAIALADMAVVPTALRAADWPSVRLGYTQFRSNLPGGRHANVRTMRARTVRVDTLESQPLAESLANEENSWTQFAGWSPEGETAILGRGWQSPENARWEEEHRAFRHNSEGWLFDIFLCDLSTQRTVNLTAVERVSFYNGGLFFWPGKPEQLGFTALIRGNSHPFRMDRDGRNKVDLSTGPDGFAYGFQSAPDGKRIAYHKNYQVYLADGDGSHATAVKSGSRFNFGPTWSPDGKWVLFLAGEHRNSHPCVVDREGNRLRKLADRGGYEGVIAFLDVPDFHGGSSDIPIWAFESQSIFYTAKIDDRVELFEAPLNGMPRRLTHSPPGTLHYHPQLSPEGKYLAYGSLRKGVRQLYVRSLATATERQLTHLTTGHAALWPHWQPRPAR